jgi:peptide chain release factor subunit 1
MSTPNPPTSSTTPPQTHDVSKIAQLIEHLDTAQSTCQSLVSLILPPTEPISQVSQRLEEEFSLASKVPYRLHRLAQMGALTSASQQLLCHSELPPNGLMIYCGEAVGTDGREELIRVRFEPWKEVAEFEYHVDDRFHTEAMKGMLGAAV